VPPFLAARFGGCRPLESAAHGVIPDLRSRDLVVREGVRVYGGGDVDVGMTEPLTDSRKRNAEAEQLGAVRVPYGVNL
jgi:hypothetical protein